MELRKEDLPAIVQAYDIQDNKEIFITEQVINKPVEVENFNTRYNGKLIKAKKLNIFATDSNGNPVFKKQRYSELIMWCIIILGIVPAAIYEFTKGWVQDYKSLFKKYPNESYTG